MFEPSRLPPIALLCLDCGAAELIQLFILSVNRLYLNNQTRATTSPAMHGAERTCSESLQIACT